MEIEVTFRGAQMSRNYIEDFGEDIDWSHDKVQCTFVSEPDGKTPYVYNYWLTLEEARSFVLGNTYRIKLES